MILSLANFFYYLFTGVSGHFNAFGEITTLLKTAWMSIQEAFFNLGGGGSAVSFDMSPDFVALTSVVLSFVLLIGLSCWILRMIWRLFTLR